MSTPVEGGRGLRLNLFGFPVHIDLSFVLIMGMLGWFSWARSLTALLVWLLVAAVAVLVHELGHAVVARSTGARPAIALTGFGGVTTYVPTGPVSRGRSLAVAVAGPLFGILAGLVVLVARVVLAPEPGSLTDLITAYGLWTTFGWSVLNLVPVLPLDGGQAMRELLPGAPAVRARRAAMVSIGVLVPLIGLTLYFRQPFIAIFLFVYGLANLQELRGSGQRQAPAAVPGLPAEQAVVGLLWQGARDQARQTLASLPPGTPVDLAVHGAVLAVTGDPGQGLALLQQEVSRRPGDENAVALLVLTHALLHDWGAVEADLTGPLGAQVPLPVVERALQEAQVAGRADVAGRLASLPLRRPSAG